MDRRDSRTLMPQSTSLNRKPGMYAQNREKDLLRLELAEYISSSDHPLPELVAKKTR